ncbi:MAG: hypothetical protein OEY26_11870, partial [Nitrospinota bacterium]|nr:hypothetical protein [Nitrospinota bacterium]
MAISRDGNSEYISSEPTFEEKAAKLEEEIKRQLEQTPARLELKGRYYAADEMTILAQCEPMRSVRILDLSDNQIDDAGLKALFEGATLEQLEELSLSINFITTAGVQEVAQSDSVKIKNLKKLSMEDNGLEDAAAVALIGSANFSH